MAMHRSMDRTIARITRSGARSRRTTACLLAVLLVGLAACNAGGQSSVTPGVTGTPPASASGTLPAPRSPAPTSDASSEPSPSVPTVVEPAMSPGPELKVIWERGGPTPSKPCTYSPTIDAEGRIWVAICWDSRFWILSPGGKFLEAWGTPGSGTGQFDFAYPAGHDSIGGIAFAPDGTFYTFDAGNLRVQHFDKNRKLMTTWGSFGTGDSQFAKPTSIAVDGQGHVFVADGARADVQVFSPDGTYVRTLAEGKAGVPRNFAFVAVDRTGNVYVNQGHSIGKYAPDGTPMAVYDLGAIVPDLSGMAVDSSGSLFVLARGDSGAEATIKLKADGTVANTWPGTGESLALDPTGTAAYVADVEWPFVRKYSLPTP